VKKKMRVGRSMPCIKKTLKREKAWAKEQGKL
jgi:hypothetical protein